MNNTKPKEMIFDFLQTVFLLVLIAFFVFYFIVGDNWEMAQKISKLAFSLSLFGFLLIIKLKTLKTKTEKREKEEKSFDDIFVYFDKSDKIKSIFAISIILILIFLSNYFFGINPKTEISQLILSLLILYIWHIYLFRKRDILVLRMHAIVLDRIVDSILIYFIPILILLISWEFDSYSYIDTFNAMLVMIILYLRHKILFDLNTKR